MDPDEQLIGEEEGRSATVYPDTSALRLDTIAIGCCVDKRIRGAGLCDAAIDVQFQHDAGAARHLATLYPGYAQMNAVRQAVIVSMCFQMGAKPLGWKQFTAALAAGNYTAAAAAGRATLWAQSQTPERAHREMAMLETGDWISQP
jgi:GH24 family phage-related lysozyme (muramidase)